MAARFSRCCSKDEPGRIGAVDASACFDAKISREARAVEDLEVSAPRTRTRVPQAFYSLAYVSANRIPSARVGLHSPVRGEPYIITPENWGNIWVYGMEMTLTGYITHDEFRNRADPIPEGTRVFQFTQTRTKNLAVPIADLRPLGDLFEKVREWETTRNA